MYYVCNIHMYDVTSNDILTSEFQTDYTNYNQVFEQVWVVLQIVLQKRPRFSRLHQSTQKHANIDIEKFIVLLSIMKITVNFYFFPGATYLKDNSSHIFFLLFQLLHNKNAICIHTCNLLCLLSFFSFFEISTVIFLIKS